MSQAGAVLLAVAGLWIAYLVPHRLRYRQQLLESRTDDRFSGALRVVRVARAAGATPGRQVAVRTGQVRLHPPVRGGGGSVDRPHRLNDRVIADAIRRTATERAQRAAHLSRRAAGARRRAVLATGLLALGLLAWAGVAAGALAVAVALVPTALLGTVLVLGRRAVVMGRRADAAWVAAAPERAARRALVGPTVVGRAVRPSDAVTELIARVPAEARDEVAEVATADDAEASVGGPAWMPVPVPRPSYALKPAVRRDEPAPLVLDEAPVAEAVVAATTAPAVPDTAGDPASAQPSVAEPTAAETTGGFDLDAVLARRRAAGE